MAKRKIAAARSTPGSTRTWSSRSIPPSSPHCSVAKFLVEDLADEAVDRDRIEPHVRGLDHPGIDDLPLRQLVEHALQMSGRVALLPANLQLLALQRHPGGVTEAEHPRHQAMIHQLPVAEQFTVRPAVAP